jgi:predicted ATPase
VISRTVDELKTLGLLLIVTYRPEFDPPWIGRPYVTALNLNRLGEREIVLMIEQVTGNKSLPESIRQDITERTDGIPLFVEEMTKAVLEAQGEGAAESTLTTIPSPSIGVPASLHASLMARLDRLGAAKEVAQIGAVLGREFSHALLAAVARKSETALKSALEGLIAAGLLFRQGVPPHASYLLSTLSCRTRLTARSYESHDGRSTLGLLRRSKPTSPRLRRTSLKWWHGIAARLG